MSTPIDETVKQAARDILIGGADFMSYGNLLEKLNEKGIFLDVAELKQLVLELEKEGAVTVQEGFKDRMN